MTIKGFATFCDDIRQEVGGKATLVGCYVGDMNVHGRAPITLPKLGVQATLISSPERAPKLVMFRIDFTPGDTVLFETTLEISEEERRKALANIDQDGTGDEPQFNVTQYTVLSPVTVPSDGRVRVRAIVDGETIKLGSLRIRFVPPVTEAGASPPDLGG